MKAALDYPNKWMKTPLEDKEAELLTKEAIRIEIIATTIHYAEVFAATLLAMRKYKRFHKFLIDYKVWEIEKFYGEITQRNKSYVTGLLQYPQLHKIQPETTRKYFNQSAKDAHKELKALAKF